MPEKSRCAGGFLGIGFLIVGVVVILEIESCRVTILFHQG